MVGCYFNTPLCPGSIFLGRTFSSDPATLSSWVASKARRGEDKTDSVDQESSTAHNNLSPEAVALAGYSHPRLDFIKRPITWYYGTGDTEDLAAANVYLHTQAQ